MILVHASPSTLEPYRTRHLGVLCSPRCVYGEDIQNWAWAADNDAFSRWDADRYRRMLDRIRGRNGCLFVTAPDVVGDAQRTLELLDDWHDEITTAAQPVALVAQDGLTVDQVPWDRVDALFIGGTDRFKMGAAAQQLARTAHRHGKWVHMGRVNGNRRLTYAKAIGCNSIDGTSLSWFRDTYLTDFLHKAAAPAQMLLSDG